MNHARITHTFSFLCVRVRYSCVGVRSLCVEYAWLCARHASAVSAYASNMVRNCARPRPSTDVPPSYHAWTVLVSRSFHWHPLTFAKRACLDALRTWHSCVGRSSNLRGILPRICSYASTCVICKWFVSDCKLYVLGSRVIHAWFVSDFCSRHPENLVNFSTRKHAQTQSVRVL